MVTSLSVWLPAWRLVMVQQMIDVSLRLVPLQAKGSSGLTRSLQPGYLVLFLIPGSTEMSVLGFWLVTGGLARLFIFQF